MRTALYAYQRKAGKAWADDWSWSSAYHIASITERHPMFRSSLRIEPSVCLHGLTLLLKPLFPAGLSLACGNKRARIGCSPCLGSSPCSVDAFDIYRTSGRSQTDRTVTPLRPVPVEIYGPAKLSSVSMTFSHLRYPMAS